jgi:Flagellar hook-length control protein FliK
MTMRLVPITEHDFSRLGGSRKAKPAAEDFSYEVFKQKNQDPKTLRKSNAEAEDLGVHEEKIEDKVEQDADAVFSESAGTKFGPVDEKTLAEGVQMFGSLFSQIEGCLSTAVTDPAPNENSSGQLSDMSNFTVTSDVNMTPPEAGDDAVVIDFAKMRARSTANLNFRKEGKEQGLMQDALKAATSREKSESHKEDLVPNVPNADVDLQQSAAFKVPERSADATSAVVGKELKVQDSDLLLPSQSAADPAPRIEQIVRAVVDQNETLAASRATIGMQELHANVTGKILRMNLHPAELGSLEIAVSKRGRRLEVSVSPELSATGSLLLKDVTTLVSSLRAADATVDHVEVRIRLADGTFKTHDMSDVLQFPSQQGGSHSFSQENPSRSTVDIFPNHEGDPADANRNEDADKYPATRRQPGAVYI